MFSFLHQLAYDTTQLDKGIPHVAATQATLDLVLNTIYGLAGALAVIFLIIGGIRYIGSQGDANAIKKAKYTITYAIVGLVVVILAFAITNYVIGHVQGSTWQQLRDSAINVLFYIAGMLAIIMIVIGGLRYVSSNGDAAKVTGAKNTILYAVIGLAISLLAYAVVNFVIGNI